MAEVLLFHHALGLTAGCRSFAGELRAGGHLVHAPDLFEGRTFTELSDGVGYAKQVGFDTLLGRAQLAAESLPGELVYAGFSLGVLAAQMLAQTRPGARGALLMYSALPASEFGPWPDGVPLQIHAMQDDKWFKEDESAARELAETVSGAELFLYPGDRHLFADSSVPDYDEATAGILMERVLVFLKNR